MGRISNYLMQAADANGGIPEYLIIDSRGPGHSLWSVFYMLIALSRIATGAIRRDLALVDPRAVRSVHQFGWNMAAAGLVSLAVLDLLAPEGDHYRTRITHTLEVSQIARTIAKALRLNEELTEAIALGHDLGHTPFGHWGERALARLVPGGFSHTRQSLRVVDVLERDGRGLNLTFEVREGIDVKKVAAPDGSEDTFILCRSADRRL